MRINQSEEALKHQTEMTALLKWEKTRHKQGDNFKWKASGVSEGLFATKTWFGGSFADPGSTHHTTNHITINAATHSAKELAELVGDEVEKRQNRSYRLQGTHPSVTGKAR